MGKAKVGELEVFYENEREFRGLVREIFERNVYYFETEKEAPVILDIGAHIGLSSLYFKKLFPKAVILAVEPNPENVRLLRQNIEVNRLENVRVLEAAVVPDHFDNSNNRSGEMYVDGSEEKWFSTGRLGKGAWDGTEQGQKVAVKTVRLAELIDWPVDLVKMDIEGGEEEVILSGGRQWEKVNRVVFEYHPIGGNKLRQVVEKLAELGFGVKVFKNGREVKKRQATGLVMVEAERS